MEERRSNKKKKKARHRKHTEQQDYASVFVFIAVSVFSSSYRERRMILFVGKVVWVFGFFVGLFFFCGVIFVIVGFLFWGFFLSNTFFFFCSVVILYCSFCSICNFIPRTMTNLILQLAFGFYSEFLKLDNTDMGIYLSLSMSLFMQYEIKDGMTLCLQHTKGKELLKQVQRRGTNLIRRLVHIPCEEE